MTCPIDTVEVLEKMKTLDEIYNKEPARKWHTLFRWLNDKAAQQSVQSDDGDSLAESELSNDEMDDTFEII